MGHQPDIGAHELGETMVFTVTVQNAVHGLLWSTKIISLSRSRPVDGGVGEGFCRRPAFHAGGPGKCPVSHPVGLCPQGEGHREAWGGGGEAGGEGGGGRVAQVFPAVSLPASPAFQVGTTPPTQRSSGGWEGGAGLRAPAPPSITWPESHKNNSFGQDRDFRKGNAVFSQPAPTPWRRVFLNPLGG